MFCKILFRTMADTEKVKVEITADISYELGSRERVKELDRFLVAEINELAAELDDIEILYGVPKTVR